MSQSNEKLLKENKSLKREIDKLKKVQTKYSTALNELEQTKDQLKAIIDAIPGSVSWIDSSLKYLGVNQVLADAFKIPASEFPGKNVGFMSASSSFIDYVKEVFKSSEASHFKEIESKIKDNKKTHLIVAQKFDNNSKAVFVGIDISKQKGIEDALRISEENYRRFFEEDLTGDYISTPDGKLLFCNSSFAKIFGFESIEDALDFDLYSLYPQPKLRDSFIHELKINGKIKLNEVELRNRQGEPVLVVENTIGSFNDNNELVEIRGFIFDITERKKLEEQVRQAQKMEAVGNLAGGIAHDFNNLLTTIQGYSDLAITSLDAADPLMQNLNQIRRAATRAGSLTNQLLIFSRKQSIELNALSVNDVIDNLIKLLKRLIGEDIEVNVQLHNDGWNIWGDVGNIEQIIMNIVVNARDAMPKGGILTIKSNNVIIDDNYCKIYKYATPGRFVNISIKDTGMGMDQSLVSHIFEPFFTTKEVGKGTGLGLSVVYGIVKQHDGWINVHSEVNNGTTFEVLLPATMSSDTKEEVKPEETSETILGEGQRILLVEDEDGIREFAGNVLTLHGYNVLSASNVDEAVRIFNREDQNFDLLFTDVVLPDKDGLELIDILFEDKPDLNVLLSSGYTDQKSQWAKIRSKGYMFLQKPYSLHDLLRYIANALYHKV